MTKPTLNPETELKAMNWIDRYAATPMEKATELEQELLEFIAKVEQRAITTTLERVERSVLPANSRILEERMATIKQELLGKDK